MVLQCLLMPEHMNSKESKAQTHFIADNNICYSGIVKGE